MADELGKIVDPDQIIVTGPPVDPRIVEIGLQKTKALKRSSDLTLKLVITTGGLGQNLPEIKSLLSQLRTHFTHHLMPEINLIFYAGTHPDFVKLYQSFNQAVHQDFPILYAPNIADANELLITQAFPWADGFITKPSGDMAYDAAAAGCFCLFLDSWGEWEDAIKDRFEHLGIGTPIDIDHVSHQLHTLTKPYWENNSWFTYSQSSFAHLSPIFTSGCTNILKLI